MTGRLIARCPRKRHVVVELLDDPDDVLVIDAPRWCQGRARQTWTAARFPLRPSAWRWAVRRYGCACGQSWLIADRDLHRWVQRGYTEILLPPSKVGRIRPVRARAK